MKTQKYELPEARNEQENLIRQQLLPYYSVSVQVAHDPTNKELKDMQRLAKELLLNY